MENLDRIFKLYSDWSSTQDDKKIKKVKTILKKVTTEASHFGDLFKEMGTDGAKIKNLFESSWEELNENKTLAKRKFASMLLEEESPKINKDGSVVGDFNLAYMPIADIADGQSQQYSTNQMQSFVSDGDRDILIQIRYAITSGNYAIAEALIINFWGRLSVKERVDIMTWAMNIGNYNVFIDVPQSKGVSFKSLKDKIEKKEITKEEFATVFLRTAKERMKAE